MKSRSPVWIIIWLILFFPVGFYLLWTNKNWSKNVKIGVSIGWVVLAIIGLASSGKSSNSTVVNSTSSQITKQATNTPVLQAGLNISRQYVIDSLQKTASASNTTLDFKQGTPVDGQDNYISQQGQNIIQLIGPSDNLTEVSSTALIGNSGNDSVTNNAIAIIYLVGVGKIVNQQSEDWVISTMKAEINSNESSIKQGNIFGGDKYMLDMEVLGNVHALTLTIDPAK